MTIVGVGNPSFRRVCGFMPTAGRRINETFLIPFRLAMWVVHFTALMCVAQGSEEMIVHSSLALGYREEDKAFLRRVTSLCFAVSYICLFFNLWGVVTARTLRFGLANFFQGGCDCAAGVLLIVSWQATAHIARLWQVFYIFSIIPTGFEILTLAYSYSRGIDVFH